MAKVMVLRKREHDFQEMAWAEKVSFWATFWDSKSRLGDPERGGILEPGLNYAGVLGV